MLNSIAMLSLAGFAWIPGIIMAGPVQAPVASADSVQILEDLRELQAEFEQFRESRIPVSTTSTGGSCDARMGRICVWFGGADEANFPREPTETMLARMDLIAELGRAMDAVRDPWIVGQLVHYLAEDERFREAEQVARECELADGWWCSALLGYALHLQDRFVEAEDAFRSALLHLPPDEEDRWLTPRFLLDSDVTRELDRLTATERQAKWDLLWRLSDPLFLVEGNDRWTEHYARLVEARNQEWAENPYGLEWEEDLEESLVRYGRNLGYSRVRSIPTGPGPGGLTLQDTRRVVGHHHPGSRGYLFPGEFLESPADVPPESWITAPRTSRTWYAPPYAPDFRGLETQVARFRRGDELLVVGAYRPTPLGRDPLADLPTSGQPADEYDPFAGRAANPQPAPSAWSWEDDARAVDIRGPVQAGLFLVPEDGGTIVSVVDDEAAGVLTLRAPPGRYVSSLELLDVSGRRAWRARQGVTQPVLSPGSVAVSDLMILRSDAPYPESVEEAILLARPGIQVARDERFTVVWEVYGLEVDEEVQVTLGFTRGRPGFLTRVGQFLGVVEPDQPVEVTFTDMAPGEVQTLFRAMVLGLPDLDGGDYTLHLRLELAGQEPVVASRPITVAP